MPTATGSGVVLRSTQFVDHLQVVLPLLREAVEEQVLVERPFEAGIPADAPPEVLLLKRPGEFLVESDELVNAKAKQALANEMSPILCIGEGLEVRELDSGTPEVVRSKSLHGRLR